MEISISQQLIAALWSIVLGVAAGFFYDILRAFRRRLKTGFFTAAADVLFWSTCAAGLFLLGFTFGEGEFRLYMLILSAVGGAVYFAALSSMAAPLCSFAASLVVFLVSCLLQPIAFLSNFLRKVLKKAKKSFIFRKRYSW